MSTAPQPQPQPQPQTSQRSNINVVKAERRKPIFSEMGVSGIKRFGGYVYEEFLKELSGKRGIKVYREMRDNDATIGAGMLAMEQVVSSATWYVNPGTKDNIGLSAANHVRECMHDMSYSWDDTIGEILTHFTYGWAFHEEVYKLRKGWSNDPKTRSKHNDGRIGWRKLPLRLQETLDSWVFDENGGIQAFTQNAPPIHIPITIPMEKGLLFRTKIYGNNPEGRSILRNTYRAWFFKKTFEELEAIGAERDLIGLPHITSPEEFDPDSPKNTEVLEGIESLLHSLRRDEHDGIYLPFGWDIKLLGAGMNSFRQFDLDRIINRWDKRIALSLLAQFIMLGMDRVGSFALSKNQNDLFLLAVQGYLDRIATVFNSFAIPRLMRLNPEFSKLEKYPTLVPGDVDTHDLGAISLFIERMVKSGVLEADDELERDMRRIAGFDDKEGEKTRVVESRDSSNRNRNRNRNRNSNRNSNRNMDRNNQNEEQNQNQKQEQNQEQNQEQKQN